MSRCWLASLELHSPQARHSTFGGFGKVLGRLSGLTASCLTTSRTVGLGECLCFLAFRLTVGGLGAVVGGLGLGGVLGEPVACATDSGTRIDFVLRPQIPVVLDDVREDFRNAVEFLVV